MPFFQATKPSKDDRRVTKDIHESSEDNPQAPQAKQQPPAQESTFKCEEAEIRATKERRASAELHQALRKKEQAAERVAAATREAERQDKILQKRLIDHYGYGHHVPTDDPKAIEIIQISVPADFLSKCWGLYLDKDKTENEDTEPDSAIAQKQGDTRAVDD